MAAINRSRLVRALINEPIHPLGPDVLLHLREYCPNLDTVTTIEDPEQLQDIIDTVEAVLEAVEQTLARFNFGLEIDYVNDDEREADMRSLRRRVRDASRYLCEVIDVLEVVYPQNDELKILARKGYALLEETAFALNMSVQEVQAQSVA